MISCWEHTRYAMRDAGYRIHDGTVTPVGRVQSVSRIFGHASRISHPASPIAIAHPASRIAHREIRIPLPLLVLRRHNHHRTRRAQEDAVRGAADEEIVECRVS